MADSTPQSLFLMTLLTLTITPDHARRLIETYMNAQTTSLCARFRLIASTPPPYPQFGMATLADRAVIDWYRVAISYLPACPQTQRADRFTYRELNDIFRDFAEDISGRFYTMRFVCWAHAPSLIALLPPRTRIRVVTQAEDYILSLHEPGCVMRTFHKVSVVIMFNRLDLKPVPLKDFPDLALDLNKEYVKAEPCRCLSAVCPCPVGEAYHEINLYEFRVLLRDENRVREVFGNLLTPPTDAGAPE